MTEWRPSPVYPELYEVSECGQVRRIVTSRGTRAGHVLRGCITVGYRRYDLYCGDGIPSHQLAHRLVCQAWHGPPPSDRHEVAHNDGNRLNSHYSNLRWATPVENQADRVKHGTHLRGERAAAAKLTAADVLKIRSDSRPYGLICAEFGVVKSTVSEIKNGKKWRHLLPSKAVEVAA